MADRIWNESKTEGVANGANKPMEKIAKTWQETVQTAGTLCGAASHERAENGVKCNLHEDCEICQLSKQAEISFKAGEESSPKPWDREQVVFEDGKQEGRKEVVEWLNKNDWGRVKGQDWQATLKEWGIEV